MSGKEDHIIFFCVKSNSEKIEKVFEVFRNRCSDIIGRGVRGFSEQVFEVERNLHEGIEDMDQKPILRMDQGSPNMAYGTRRLIRDLEMVISPSRANRPTDNARQERWYRTIKQEEIYCFRDYPDIVIARRSIGKYVREYNELRPHQALWNFTPAFVHRVGNKTKLMEYKRRMVQIVKEQRIRTNRKLTSLVDGGVPRYDISQK